MKAPKTCITMTMVLLLIDLFQFGKYNKLFFEIFKIKLIETFFVNICKWRSFPLPF